MQHASDCAVHNAPALSPGPCDCGARIMELEAMLRELVERFNPAPDFNYTPLAIWDRAALVLHKSPDK